MKAGIIFVVLAAVAVVIIIWGSRCKRSGTERTRIAHTLTADTSDPSEVSPAELGREFQASERPR